MTTAELSTAELAQQARAQLRAIVAEIAALAEAAPDEATFFARFAERSTVALAAHGCAVWRVEPRGSVSLYCEHQCPAEFTAPGPVAGHNAQLVFRSIHENEPLLVAAADADFKLDADTWPEMLLILAPVRLGAEAQVVIEIFQRTSNSTSAQRGYAALAGQLADLASTFLKNRQLRELQSRQAQWDDLNRFHRAVHASLDLRQVCYTTANEARQLIGCDRVSVAWRHGRRYRTVAVSGQDTIDRRASVIRRLNTLATTVAQTGQPFWYTGGRLELAPQLDAALEDYLDQAHAKAIGIVPLVAPPRNTAKKPKREPKPIGVLIVEQINDTSSLNDWQQRTEAVVEQCLPALVNAKEHGQLFLLPLWRALGKARALFQGKTLPKTVAAVIGIAGLVAALVFVPYDFALHAPGALQPVLRREVFAAADGTVDRVLVKHGQHVERGQLLAQLRNTDLDVEITELMGQVAATQEQLSSIERSLVEDAKRLTPEERNRLAGQRSEGRQRLASLSAQLELRQAKRKKLQALSPLSGEVITWNIEQLLDERPVRQGQALMSVADTSADWELELRLPEARMGYLAAALAENDNALPVTFRLATEPGTDYRGTVTEVHLAAEIRGEEENTVLVRVRFDKHTLAHLQPGAECRAKIHCGERSLGFVLLHDLVAFVQSRILFRL